MTDSVPMTVREQHFVEMFGDAGAAKALAVSFAHNMMEAAVRMTEDDPTIEIPDVDGIKNMTADFAKDMVADFQAELMQQIDKVFAENKIVITSKREVSITSTF